MIEGGLASRCIVLECEPRKYTQRQRELSSMPTEIIEIAQQGDLKCIFGSDFWVWMAFNRLLTDTKLHRQKSIFRIGNLV
jgi:hypothetical protein